MKKIFGLVMAAAFLATSLTAFAAEEKNTGINFDNGYISTGDFEFVVNEGAQYTLDNGKLNLTGAGDGAYIAPKGSYDAFAIQFDISGFTPGQASWVGLAFGQPAQDSLFFQQSQLVLIANDGIMIHNFAAEGAPLYPLTKSDSQPAWVGGARTWAGGNDTFIDDNDPGDGFGDKVNTIKLVVKDNKVTVYRKNNIDEGQDARFQVIDGQWDNIVNTSGYLKICFTGSTTVAIDNIKFSSNPDADLSAVKAVEEVLVAGTADAPSVETTASSVKASWTLSAAKYAVNLFDASGKLVASKNTTDKTVTFSNLQAANYQVQVVAIDANNLVVATTKIAQAEVKTATNPTDSSSSTPSESKGTDIPNTSERAPLAIMFMGLATIAVIGGVKGSTKKAK